MTQDEYKKMIAFLDSLPKEEVCKNLEEEIKRFAYTLPYSKTESIISAGWVHKWELESVIQIGKHIAHWQKERLINKACEWLRNDMEEGVIPYFDEGLVASSTADTLDDFISDFRKHLEDEE